MSQELRLKNEVARLGARVQTHPVGESLTKQASKEECDINEILARAGASGYVNHLNKQNPLYTDVSGIPDYQSSLNFIRESQEAFMQLPAKMRERFENDPGRMLAFLQDENNRKEAVELGLLAAPPEPPKEGAPPPAAPPPNPA